MLPQPAEARVVPAAQKVAGHLAQAARVLRPRREAVPVPGAKTAVLFLMEQAGPLSAEPAGLTQAGALEPAVSTQAEAPEPSVSQEAAAQRDAAVAREAVARRPRVGPAA